MFPCILWSEQKNTNYQYYKKGKPNGDLPKDKRSSTTGQLNSRKGPQIMMPKSKPFKVLMVNTNIFICNQCGAQWRWKCILALKLVLNCFTKCNGSKTFNNISKVQNRTEKNASFCHPVSIWVAEIWTRKSTDFPKIQRKILQRNFFQRKNYNICNYKNKSLNFSYFLAT